ncbi:TPA: hypothetical protein P0E36_004890 [Vibrio harveyi]|nr:hypothetical protein [Vibrio harveyi]
MKCNEVGEASPTFAKYLKQFDLSITDLSNESGRSKHTLNQWYRRDPQIITTIITAALANRLVGGLTALRASQP